jgi:hypothetical protein
VACKKTRHFFYNFLFAIFHRKPGILIPDLYLYSIKIEINIKQKFDRKICGKVTEFFWTRLDPAQGRSCPAQQIVEKRWMQENENKKK